MIRFTNDRLLSSIAVAVFVSTAHGQAIFLDVAKSEYNLYEPFVFSIRYDAHSAMRPGTGDVAQFGRGRGFQAELRESQGKVSDVILIAPQHSSPESDVMTFAFLGLAGTLAGLQGDGAILELWNRPGSYTLVVSDSANRLRSNSVSLVIAAPDHALAEAAALFSSAGVALPWALVGHPQGTGANRSFQNLVQEYPLTVYGKYAQMGLVLSEAHETLNSINLRKPEAIQTSQLVERLQKMLDSFERGHPLRGEAMFSSARLLAASGKTLAAEIKIRELLRESNDNGLRASSENYLGVIKKSVEVPTSANP